MHEYPIIIFTALLIFLLGLFSRLSERSPITAPMVFVTVGMLISPYGLDFLKAGINAPLVRVIAEVTLVMVLFVDASTINLRSLIRERGLPFRLLLIGLPLTMILGLFGAKLLFDHMNIWALALMAFILSPTDAALGQAVVTSAVVPENIKQAINVESGLNDGIALPPILVCIAGLSAAATEQAPAHYWVVFTMKQFLFGPLLGGLVGWLGGVLVDRASRAGWMNSTFQRLTSMSLAVLAFASAEMFHGNGFIAAFFGGLMLGTHTPIVRERIQEFGEAEGQQLQLFVFLLLGLILVPKAADYWDGRAWLYAVFSLTLIRMLPVAISLVGTNLAWPSIAFIGWFGPRGIASILYLLLVVMEIGLAGHEQMMSIIVLTVLLSVFLHGITAVPLSRFYGGRVMGGGRLY
jgi:NhaP-type Na+/H+ or K+/H+ antiporter